MARIQLAPAPAPLITAEVLAAVRIPQRPAQVRAARQPVAQRQLAALAAARRERAQPEAARREQERILAEHRPAEDRINPAQGRPDPQILRLGRQLALPHFCQHPGEKLHRAAACKGNKIW